MHSNVPLSPPSLNYNKKKAPETRVCIRTSTSDTLQKNFKSLKTKIEIEIKRILNIKDISPPKVYAKLRNLKRPSTIQKCSNHKGNASGPAAPRRK